MEAAIHQNLLTLDKYFISSDWDDTFVSDLDEIAHAVIASTELETCDSFEGGCWLWLADSRHPLVRALLKKGRITITGSGKYFANFPQISPLRPLHQRQSMIEEISSKVAQRYDVGATYMSIPGSKYADDIPFYCGSISERGLVYNRNFEYPDE